LNRYSIIIPFLNEEHFLSKSLNHLKKFTERFEILAVDGDSKDNSVKICENFGVKVLQSEPSRGTQLNVGASNSTGEILIFLHADTFLPLNTFDLLRNFFANEKNQIATFRLGFDKKNLILKLYTLFTTFDSVFTTFGDQAICVRRSFFNEIGKFPEHPIFEDVSLLRKARKQTKIKKFPASVTSSARRFEEKGIVKTQLITLSCFVKYFMGKSTTEIYQDYYR